MLGRAPSGRHLTGFAFGSWLRHRFAALQAAHANPQIPDNQRY
jgi:hypothetical protein